jgi:hypothetical protein
MKVISVFCFCFVFALLVFAAFRDSNANSNFACYGQKAPCASLKTVY